MSDVSDKFGSGGWRFDSDVVGVFDEHVADHVPHYGVFQEIVAHLSDWLAPDGSTVLDLGASTGTTVKLIADRHPNRRLEFLLVDAAVGMLDAARTKLTGDRVPHGPHSFGFGHVDLNTSGVDAFDIGAEIDLVVALFTLQFLRPSRRLDVLRDAFQHTRTGGALLIAEKVTQPSAFWQEIANEATWDYKSERGVDAETIRSKARALRGVLVPLPPGDVESLIVRSGWSEPVPIWRWHNWGLWAAEAR